MATPPPPREDADALRRLLHRWFVEYNPLALASAMLVLVGLNLLSKGLAERASVSGALGVALVAEVYALALISSAALAYRIRAQEAAESGPLSGSGIVEGDAVDHASRIAGRIAGMTYENPHGLLRLRTEGGEWTVELAPPSRMRARGLEPEAMADGVEATLEGYPHRATARLMRAERIVIAGRTTELR